MNLQQEIEKLVLENLRKTVPAAAKQASAKEQFIDNSTKLMGFSKITKPGYTP